MEVEGGETLGEVALEALQDEQEVGSIWLHLKMSNEEETANVALSTLVEVVGHKDSAFASNPVIPLLNEVAKVWPLYLCQKAHVPNMCRLIHIWTSLGKEQPSCIRWEDKTRSRPCKLMG